jgi:hypothetical protein
MPCCSVELAVLLASMLEVKTWDYQAIALWYLMLDLSHPNDHSDILSQQRIAIIMLLYSSLASSSPPSTSRQ